MAATALFVNAHSADVTFNAYKVNQSRIGSDTRTVGVAECVPGPGLIVRARAFADQRSLTVARETE